MSAPSGVEAIAAKLEDVLMLPRVARGVSAALAAGSGAVLATARWLDPSPDGHGTHLQLGLGQCTFLQWTGQPCPMCGATTTFSLAADFRWLEALTNQPFASLLFAMTVATFAISTAEVIAPRGRWRAILTRMEPYEGFLATAFLAFMAASWLYKAWRMSGA